MANENEYSNKVWFMASYPLALLRPDTESQYVSARHTEENGYMSANLLPPVHCMSSCYVARLFGVNFFFFYSFRLTEN